LPLTITQPALPRSHVARLEIASQRSRKYRSQSGLVVSVIFLYLMLFGNILWNKLINVKRVAKIAQKYSVFICRLSFDVRAKRVHLNNIYVG